MLDPVEVTMKEDSNDCIPRRRVFSTLAKDGYRIPLFRGIDAQGCGQLLAFNFNGARNFSENHRRGTRPSGIMISRRPKRRASSEKAPGPSKKSAADIAARLKAVSVLMWLLASVIKNDETPVIR